MQDESPIQELLQKCQRDINCLLDQDRNLKRRALISLKTKLCGRSANLKLSQQVYEKHTLKNLLHAACDSIDFVREKAIKLNSLCIEKFENMDDDNIVSILEILISRVNTLPYQEKSEEVRLLIVRQFDAILEKYPNCYKSLMSSMSNVIAKLLQDPFPEVKKDLSALIEKFCEALPIQVGLNGTPIAQSLIMNTTHQHSKVRKASVKALNKLLITQHGGDCFDFCSKPLKRLLGDKSSDVRKAVFQLVADCLQCFCYPDLKKHEATLVIILLSGFIDGKDSIREFVKEKFEVCGESRKALAERMLEEEIAQEENED